MNKVILIGNIGRDPEVRTTNSGKTVANFGLATSEKRGGEAQTTLHDVTCWEKTAQLVGDYVKKGDKLCVEGRIQHREYEDKDGNTRKKTEIVADRIEFIGNKKEDAPAKQSGGDDLPF